jgi:hypothetical protein
MGERGVDQRGMAVVGRSDDHQIYGRVPNEHLLQGSAKNGPRNLALRRGRGGGIGIHQRDDLHRRMRCQGRN